MHHNYYLSLLVVALAMGLAFPGRSAEPISLQNMTFAQVQQKFPLETQHNLSIATDSLSFVSERTDQNKITHVRMQQQYTGFPVHGGYAIMHSVNTVKSLAATRATVLMNGIVYQGLANELGQADVSFVKNAPRALQQFKSKYANEDVREENVTPMVYIDGGHRAHWAYKISIFIHQQDRMPQRPTALVDANTQQILVQWDDIKTQKMVVKGVGFSGNIKIGSYQFGTNLPYLDLTRDTSAALCFMENKDVKIIDMRYRDSIRVMRFNCPTNSANIYVTGYKNDGYDKVNGAFSPTNDALYSGSVIKQMYFDWYNTTVLTNSDGSPMKLIMRVHYGDGFENAYWDGQQMTFGDGDSMMYPLVSLGVAAHEISHGFTSQHSGLEYYGQSGAMDEAFSDMAAQVAEYYSSGKSNWKIGGEVMKEDSGLDVMRYMDQPSRDGESIDNAEQYNDDLDVHYSCGVYNRLFYTLANQPNWTPRLAFDVMVKANMDYWTPYSTFDEGACGLLSATADLGYSLTDVVHSLKTVAIHVDACNTSTL